jgi:hypothetical protein
MSVERIIDIGCGWADKLNQIHVHHPSWSYVGVDFGSNIAHCRSTHDWGAWSEQDLEQPWLLDARGAVIVCSDVIEHVADPRSLVHVMARSGAAAIIISTPERDLQHGPHHNGPPQNPHHVREWNGAEFASFLTSEGLKIRHIGLTRGNDQSMAMATQLVIATP